MRIGEWRVAPDDFGTDWPRRTYVANSTRVPSFLNVDTKFDCVLVNLGRINCVNLAGDRDSSV